MRGRPSFVGWLEWKLWALALGGLMYLGMGFVLPYHSAMPLSYVWLSRTGAPATGTVEGYRGREYSYATADGARHHGRSDRRLGSEGDTVPVYYWTTDPEVSVPRIEPFEWVQRIVALLVLAACAASLVSRALRALRPPPPEGDEAF